MSLSRLCLGFIVLSVLAASAAADPVVLGSSGWTLEFLGSRVTGTAAVVAEGQDFVKIRIDKVFGEAIFEDGEWDFPVGQINFTQTGPNPTGTIIIESESITNNTGLAWPGYQWSVLPGGNAVFDATASAGWTVTPFGGWVAEVPTGSGHSEIVAGGGTGVADGAVFNPGGGLVIHATGDFTFKQTVVPEPATLTLALLGLPLALRRRKRR